VHIDDVIAKLQELKKVGARQVLIGRDFVPAVEFEILHFPDAPMSSDIVFFEEEDNEFTEFSRGRSPASVEEMERRKAVDDTFGEEVDSGRVTLQTCMDYIEDVRNRR